MRRVEEVERPAFYEVSGWRKLAMVPLAFFLRLWFATFRFELAPEVQAHFRSDPRGHLFVLWHNRLLVVSEFHRRFRRALNTPVGLVSGSKDGAWLAALFNMLGVGAVRGSQNRRGAAGARELLGILRSGYDTGITVDGSRGPVYEAKEGAALLAMKSGAPLVFFSPRFHQAWRFKSWDGFFLPKPFCRVEFRIALYENIEHLCPGADRRAATVAITAKLRELAAGSDPELGL